MKAQDIINKTRKELKDFIVYEMKLICSIKKIVPNFEMEEDYKLTFGTDLNSVNIQVFIYDSYSYEFEDGNYQFIPADLLLMSLDEDIYVTSKELDDDEINWDELKTDDLVKIADALETAYNNLIKK